MEKKRSLVPEFFVAAAQKCGTTAHYSSLLVAALRPQMLETEKWAGHDLPHWRRAGGTPAAP